MIKEQICQAFCDDLLVTEVPVGLAVKTPFKKENGDAITFYIVWLDDTKTSARIEDDGDTMPYLEACGVDFSIETRKETLVELLEEHGAQFDEEQYLLHTDYYSESEIPKKAIRFTSLLLRLQDFALMMTQRKAEDTFKSDLIAAIHERFDGEATVEEEEPLDNTMQDYVADVIIRPRNGDPLAVFVGSSEIKALEAILFGREVRERKKEGVKYMLVFQNAKPAKIKERTLARAINTPELQIASFMNQKTEVLSKMAISMGIESRGIH